MTEDQESTPTAVVDRQVDAYNAGDPDAFAACYGENAVVASLGDGERLAEGREGIRQQWGQLFEANPDLHCEVTDELAIGEFVACRERVTGMGDPVEALAVYRVSEGTIQRVWLGYDD